MILSFLFFTFVAYLIFKLVFDFIIPVYKTTRQVKQKFRDMNEQMRGQQGQQASQNNQPKNNTDKKKSTLGEYIDFEEVKD
ncbi:hypothetical protein [Flavisolibacter ginsenosidimutans]|uniref:DUF4834 family protein n=1 Tax=Flavisolibacter ginsenosidimutans TaxID=661481 RepID=A0A5B8ULQ6_9BACT|nr:hypothetical protein [Flavisolibacter ginsenosidimutans]QEC57631.1 hypothetical protein FSB75_17555 [Flavisolibacter ginsenosidimutans]